MRIAVLVSGGVDSSVALAQLKEQGHDITAFYLKIWLEDELSYLGSCPWEEDLQYAQQAWISLSSTQVFLCKRVLGSRCFLHDQ